MLNISIHKFIKEEKKRSCTVTRCKKTCVCNFYLCEYHEFFTCFLFFFFSPTLQERKKKFIGILRGQSSAVGFLGREIAKSSLLRLYSTINLGFFLASSKSRRYRNTTLKCSVIIIFFFFILFHISWNKFYIKNHTN